MKKVFILFLMILLVGCSNDDTVDNSDSENKPEIKETETIKISLWNVKPTIEVDRIDPWLVVRKLSNSIIACEGADPGIYEPILDFAITYNRNDFYNSTNNYPFLLGSYKSGGTIIGVGNKSGLINPDGDMVLEPKNHYRTSDTAGTTFDVGDINYDYSIGYDGGHPGGSNGCSGLFLTKDGSIYYPFMDENIGSFDNYMFSKTNFYDKAIECGFIKDGEYVLLNTHASKVDKDNYKYKDNLPDDLIVGYVLYNKNNYKVLNIQNNYVACDYSNNIVLFAKANKSPYDALNMADSIYGRQSKLYYAYEYCCDQYEYSDFTYVDQDGKTIASGYEDGYGFYEGYAAVKKNNKWGYIDTKGNIVVDFIFESASPIIEGKSWVIYNGKLGKLNIIDMINNDISFIEKVLNSDYYEVIIDK